MKRIVLLITTIVSLSFGTQAQIVNIPDVNFKAYLVGNAAINTNADAEIQVSEANAFAGTINCSTLSIFDLTGIEAFTALTNLQCTSNSITVLDVSNNINLTNLHCTLNPITILDVSSNTGLYWLDCDDLLLTTLDVSNNTSLEYLYCNGNSLTSLDVSQNILLLELICHANQLSSLNAANGNNTNIINFFATNNPNLTCIEVDDAVYSTTNWTSIDAASSFSENCCSIDLSVTETGNTITATLTGATYQWVDCDNGNAPVSGETNQSFTPTSNGNYACIIDDGNCSDMSACTAITTISIDALNSSMINIYPNPASTEISVDSEEMIEGVTIFNMFGELVQQEISATFSVSTLSNGVYVMNIQTSKGISRSRFIKE
ncbi:MAG: hypothetical protein ACI837_001728 [Crocinitomicaceae bacterium]|jgi:hypothetical protein